MILVEPVSSERPSAPRRRKEVLEAAERCFGRHGFHASSMAEIAAESKMSVGLIYRHFPSKESIIAAIVERDVRQMELGADALHSDPAGIFPALFKYLRDQVRQRSDRINCALFLEVMAEAARNPKTGNMVAVARRRVAARLSAVVTAACLGRWSHQEVEAKVDLLLILLDSVAFKAVGDFGFDSEKMADQIVDYAEQIFQQRALY